MPFAEFELTSLGVDEQRQRVDNELAKVQKSLKLSEGPIVRMNCFDPGLGEPGLLAFIVHHLAINPVHGQFRWKTS